ncbi:Hypothetical protein EAG7_00821 [Klebsiella aerogenes]|nr:Hypothetical protein EAG7_00821 [Klebsiella aerogenes]
MNKCLIFHIVVYSICTVDLHQNEIEHGALSGPVTGFAVTLGTAGDVRRTPESAR